MIHESSRSGVRHRYDVQPDGLRYSAGSTTQIEIRWNELARIESGKGESLYLIPRKRQKLGVWLEPKAMEEFLRDVIQAWGAADRDAAAKAAFDYGEDVRVNGWIWLTVAVLFPGLLALLLLSDAFQTLACNHALEAGTAIAPAQVSKVKKDSRGSMIWSLTFQPPGSAPIKGKRAAFEYDEKGKPKGPVTVVYAPANRSCWDLSLRAGENAIDMKQRRFSLLMAMSFGWVFAVIGFAAIWASVARIRRRQPFREVVRKAGMELIPRTGFPKKRLTLTSDAC